MPMKLKWLSDGTYRMKCDHCRKWVKPNHDTDRCRDEREADAEIDEWLRGGVAVRLHPGD